MTHSLSRWASVALLLGLFAGAAGADEKKPRLDLSGDPLPDGALARLGSLRLRHGDPVSFVSFLPGGKTVLAAGSDGIVRIWDVANGKELRRFGHSQDTDARKLAVRQFGRGQPLLVSLSSDGKVLAASTMNSTETVLWDVAAGKELKRFTSTDPSNAIALSPDGKLIAVSCSDSNVHLYDRDGKKVRTLTSAEIPMNGRFFGGMMGMAFAPDGKTIVLSGMEFDNGMLKRSVRAWDPGSGKLLYRIDTNQRSIYGTNPTFSPDGKTLALGSWNNEIVLFDAATGKERIKIKTSISRLDGIAFTANGKAMVGRSLLDGSVCMWDTATGKELKTIAKPAAGALNLLRARTYSPYSSAGAVSLSEDGKQLAAADGNLVHLIDLATGKDAIPSIGHHGRITGLLFQAAGKSILSMGADGTIRLWEAATGKQTGTVAVPQTAYGFTLSPDGKLLAVESTDASTRIVDTASGKELRRIDHPLRQLQSAYAFSLDGKLLAVRNRLDSATRVYSLDTGKLLVTLGKPLDPNQPLRYYLNSIALAFSPDGKTLAAPGLEGGLILWDVPSGLERSTITMPQAVQVRDVTFSPDGRTYALDMNDNRVVVYELASGLERRKYVPRGQENPNLIDPRFGIVNYSNNFSGTRTLSYSPDGKRLALAANSRTVHVWDLLTGEEIGQLKGHQGDVTVAVFGPDSKTLATASDDATALLWDVSAFKSKTSLPAKLDDPAVQQFWNDLQAADGPKAFAAVAALASAPEGTAFLGRTLKAPETVEESKIVKLIADLDARRFPTRKKAQDELEKLGWMAAPALKKALEGKPSEEARKWVTELLEKTKGQTLSPVQLQLVRAVEALERAGTLEAKAVLERLSKGPGGALETLEAKAALSRIR